MSTLLTGVVFRLFLRKICGLGLCEEQKMDQANLVQRRAYERPKNLFMAERIPAS